MMTAGPLRKTAKTASSAARRSSEDDSLPSLEAAKARLSKSKGFAASLSPEGLAALRDYDGPEVSGPMERRKVL